GSSTALERPAARGHARDHGASGWHSVISQPEGLCGRTHLSRLRPGSSLSLLCRGVRIFAAEECAVLSLLWCHACNSGFVWRVRECPATACRGSDRTSGRRSETAVSHCTGVASRRGDHAKAERCRGHPDTHSSARVGCAHWHPIAVER